MDVYVGPLETRCMGQSMKKILRRLCEERPNTATAYNHFSFYTPWEEVRVCTSWEGRESGLYVCMCGRNLDRQMSVNLTGIQDFRDLQ